MIILTDNPVACAEFGFAEAGRWIETTIDDLPDTEHAAWRAVGTSRPIHRADIDDASRATLVIIDRASDSQFNAINGALKRGVELPDALVCLALEGEKFRGQRERPWTALRGNMHLTAHYAVGVAAPRVEKGLIMLPSVSVAQTLIDLFGDRVDPKIKWVNDVMIGSRKISGVLTATQVQGDRVGHIVFGIGLNILRAPEIEPTPFVPAAGSLADLIPEQALSQAEIVYQLIQTMDAHLQSLLRDGPGLLFDQYRRRANYIGRFARVWPEGTVNWRTTPPEYAGKVLDLLPDLSLRLDGHDQPVRRGRLAIAPH